jgi:hypothetical protein
MILNHLRWMPFIAGIIAGILAMIFYKPEIRTIIEYPHPKEAENKIFRDRTGVCYKYTSHEVDCDSNEGTLKDYPLQ